MAVRKNLKLNYYGFLGVLGFLGFVNPWYFLFFAFFLFFFARRSGVPLGSEGGTSPAGKSNLSGFMQGQEKEKQEHLQKIMEGIDMQKSINNDSVQNLLGVSDATAERYLNELEKQGKIKQIGDTGRGVFYERA